MRLHESAPEITTPLRARAVTIGQDIYFHPGQFRPGTPGGDKLINHEFAHTLQTRQTAGSDGRSAETVSSPGDSLEQNADALARGVTTTAIAAPVGAILRSPFDSESTGDHARRQQLIQSTHNAEASLIRLLQSGGLVVGDEVAAERAGVRGVIVPASTSGRSDENFVSYAARDRMIRRIIRSLVSMAAYYRTHPIPGELPPSTIDENGRINTTIATEGGTSSYGGGSDALSQLQAAYELKRMELGQTGDEYNADWYYLTPDLRISPGAARSAPRIGGGVQSGAYMVFPDIENEPLRYWRLDGYSPTPTGSTIVEFWHDDIGYYYTHHGQRIDVPSPWSR